MSFSLPYVLPDKTLVRFLLVTVCIVNFLSRLVFGLGCPGSESLSGRTWLVNSFTYAQEMSA
jgi:hypothetical protein